MAQAEALEKQKKAEEIGKQFVQFYYTTFDSNRSELAVLYNKDAKLTWEGTMVIGGQNVVEHLKNLPFTRLQHQVQEIDIQLVELPGGLSTILVSVGGRLLIDDSPNPLQFGRIFHLVPEGTSFFLLNDIFRLRYSDM